jgi:hypothetical protein
VEITARVRPETLGAALKTLQPAAELDREMGRLVALGMRQNVAKVDVLVAALQMYDRPGAWAGCLTAMLERAPTVPLALLEAALASRAPGVREDAVWTVGAAAACGTGEGEGGASRSRAIVAAC